MTSIPAEHRVDSVKLQADAQYDLFQIQLTDGQILYLSPRDTVTWQGDVYDSIAIHLTGVGKRADDEKSRPKLTIMNFEGIFNVLIAQKIVYGATVRRYRVLGANIEANRNIAEIQSWKVRRPERLTRSVIVLQLADQLDGQFFILPARQFLPPEFPTVSLS